MSEISAQWSEVNLEEFVPTPIIDLVESVAEPILEFVGDAAALARTQAQLLKLTTANVVAATDPVIAAIAATLTSLDNTLNDLINTGAGLVIVPPQLGGLANFGNALRVALTNTRLQNRPTISEQGYVAGFGALAYAPDLVTIRAYHNDIVGAIAADDYLKLKLGLTELERTGSFQRHDLKYKLARSAGPQPDAPWTSVSAGKFIPKSAQLVGNISAYLQGVSTKAKTDPIDRFITSVDRFITNVDSVLEQLQQTVDFIENAFPDLPLKLWRVSPQAGGTQSVADSTRVWLDKTTNTILQDVPNNAFVTGFFVLIGATELVTVQANYDIWDDLILP